jgi:4-hydroxybenzoyl-CoA reductase subunit beta
MTALPAFELLRPTSLESALHAASHARIRRNARFLAGGTDLMVNIRRGMEQPEMLIDLGGIDSLKTISKSEDGWRIGAGVTLTRIVEHGQLASLFPAFAQAAGAVAAATHRNMATLGGNLCQNTRCVYFNQSEWWRSANQYCLKHRGDICHVAPSGSTCFAAYHGDVAPALMVHDARLDIAGSGGVRTVSLNGFFSGDGKAPLLLAPDEILTAIHLPATAATRSVYEKARIRGAIDFPLAGVAARVEMNGDTIARLAIALTGVDSRPVLLADMEMFSGREPGPELANAIVRAVPRQIQPMTSTFTPPGHRRKVAINMIWRVLGQILTTA